MEGLLARVGKLGKVADFGHAARELCASLGRLAHLRRVLRGLLRRDRMEPGLAGVQGDTQRFGRRAVLWQRDGFRSRAWKAGW